MPIGSSKVGVMGAGLTPGGSETFNTSGTFVVPTGISEVSVTGLGGTGNPGSPGNPGVYGSGGSGGYAVSGGGAGAGAPRVDGNSGTAGNPGTASTALGLTFPGGSGGSGGSGGLGGPGGNPGGSGSPMVGGWGGPAGVGGTGSRTGGVSARSLAAGPYCNPCGYEPFFGPFQGYSVRFESVGGGGGGGAIPTAHAPSYSTCPTNANIQRCGLPGAVNPLLAGSTGGYAAAENYWGSPCYTSVPRTPAQNVPSCPSYRGYGAGGASGGFVATGGGNPAKCNFNWASPVYTAASPGAGGGGSGYPGGACGAAGGSGNPASPTTYNAQAVAPGSSYPVSVASGGQVIISWNPQ